MGSLPKGLYEVFGVGFLCLTSQPGGLVLSVTKTEQQCRGRSAAAQGQCDWATAQLRHRSDCDIFVFVLHSFCSTALVFNSGGGLSCSQSLFFPVCAGGSADGRVEKAIKRSFHKAFTCCFARNLGVAAPANRQPGTFLSVFGKQGTALELATAGEGDGCHDPF